jgi:hypothetical protein
MPDIWTVDSMEGNIFDFDPRDFDSRDDERRGADRHRGDRHGADDHFRDVGWSHRSRLAGTLPDEDDVLVGDQVGGVSQRRVFPRQTQVGVEEINLRGAFAQLAEDKFDGNSPAADDRLARLTRERSRRCRRPGVRALSESRPTTKPQRPHRPRRPDSESVRPQGPLSLHRKDEAPRTGAARHEAHLADVPVGTLAFNCSNQFKIRCISGAAAFCPFGVGASLSSRNRRPSSDTS